MTQNCMKTKIQFSVMKEIKKTEKNAHRRRCNNSYELSENYSTKYGQEIQAFQFGGSFYWVSTNVPHSPSAILAHLAQTIFNALPPQIKNMHFLSEGLVTKNRNKTMFYIMVTKLPNGFHIYTSLPGPIGRVAMEKAAISKI